MRRRRCFENAKPRRSAEGAQLNRFLGKLEGPIRDPVLARLPRVAAFSRVESGFGEPPDRAQICAPMMMMKPFNIFFLSQFLDRQNGIYSDETRKRMSEKVILSEYVHRTVPNMVPEPRLVWFAMTLLSVPPKASICFLQHIAE